MRKMGGIAICLLATLVLASLAGAQAQSDEGLVAEWHFDGDAKDSSGNGNDGIVNGATFVEGKFGKALSFDGVNDYVEVPTISSFPYGNSARTVEMWIYTTTSSWAHDAHTILPSSRQTMNLNLEMEGILR